MTWAEGWIGEVPRSESVAPAGRRGNHDHAVRATRQRASSASACRPAARARNHVGRCTIRSDEPLRLALIGYGTGGAAFHAPLIAAVPALRLDAIVTRDPARRAQARLAHPDAAILDRAADVWNDAARYDVVVITTPNRTHAPLALEALRAGMHVVVDKPFATSAAEAAGVIAEARRQGRIVSPYHNRRWDGDFLTLQRVVASGRLGRITRFESRLERWRPIPRAGWRESPDPADAGGILYDLGSHLIDQALLLFGPALDVHAEVDTRRAGTAVDDDVFVALAHAGGVRSHLYMSALAAQPGARFRLSGDRAAFVKHGVDPQEAALRAGRTPAGDAAWGADAPEHFGTLGSDGELEPVPTLRGAYQDYYGQLAAAIAGQGPVPVDAADAVAVLEIIETARRSSD